MLLLASSTPQMSPRTIYFLTLSGALGGWLGEDLFGQLFPDGPVALESGMVGASLGLLLGVATGWRHSASRLAMVAALGSLASFAGGFLARGGTALLVGFPDFLAIGLTGTVVGAAIGLALTGTRTGPIGATLGGTLGGLLAAGLTWSAGATRLAGLSVSGLSAAILGGAIGLGLALAAVLGENRPETAASGITR